jgi:hypothetical protein
MVEYICSANWWTCFKMVHMYANWWRRYKMVHNIVNATLIGGRVAGFNCGQLNLHKTESEPPMHRFTVIIYEYFSTVEGIYWKRRTLFCCRLTVFGYNPLFRSHLSYQSTFLTFLSVCLLFVWTCQCKQTGEGGGRSR